MADSQPVTITGTTYALYLANVAALLAGGVGVGYGWRALGNLRLINGIYTRTFQQFFPLRQPYAGPSVYGTWTTQIPAYF